MLSRLRVPLAAAVAAAGLVALGAATESAAACDGADVGCTPPSTDGRTVTISVSGSLVQSGSDGDPGGSTTVSMPVPCYLTPLWTGKEYYKGIKDGTITGAGWDEWNDTPWKPYAGYKKHKDDDKGHWYVPTCTMDDSFEDFEDFDKHTQEFFLDNPGTYVEANEQPPVPPVPPEILLRAATEAMTMPEPAFDHNPDITGDSDTLVNMDTWFWLRDPSETGDVTATAGPNSVRVDARLDAVEFNGDTAGSVQCADPGVKWTPNSTSDCVLTFQQAGEHEVTATTEWGLAWSFNGEPQGEIDPIGAEWNDTLGVAESQALVTGVR